VLDFISSGFNWITRWSLAGALAGQLAQLPHAPDFFRANVIQACLAR
jgi:hypothetical protein